ncbi:bifunctional UDP-sugar hydrolase/5'-nucleotidase [Virgibacillus sp. C22-A2]|uniref:Bifunctional UDP-sugar hydrolase/5'-nucleotidase n=1 Tax=Virgibacillus tibetensis TaxID=3042313 RepID=A0ABU6KHV0_9BACI|nr:bifunctional UDP-sugar hydrolase/5'-nucleotidase [Virgibacillus sp. C22-A2]
MQDNSAKVTILYTSDIHGHAMPILYGPNEPADIGLTKYATIVKKYREENDHLLVLDNGDLIQGTPLMTHYVKEHMDKKNPLVGIMNRIGIDAGVIGNHEFNFGTQVLSDAVEQSEFPWLSANIVDEKTDKPAFGPPYIIKKLDNGIKIAVIGVTTHYIPNWESPEHIKGIRFDNAFHSLQKWVSHIREAEKPDVLIVSYHGGFERDIITGEPTEALTGENQGYQMCQEIEGIDVLLTGHQHRTLTGRINGVLVVQPSKNGHAYGEVQIDLMKSNREWNITAKRAVVQTLDQVESAPEILRYMTSLERSTQNWLDQPIGYIEGDMSIKNPFEARVTKHPFIEFIQNVQMDASGVDISVTSLLNNSSEGFSSVVTMRDIVANYMYPNTLVVLELTGKDIKDALEKSAAYFVLDENQGIGVNPTYVEPKPQHYNYDMWEGIEYKINISKQIGSRVEYIHYHGKQLKADASCHVVLNNYRATGGGNYDMFKHKPVIREIQKDAVELIRDYFEKHKTVKATTTENFSVTVE